MRFLLLCVLALTGCKPPILTTAKAPNEAEKRAERRLSLIEARQQICANGGMSAAELKAFLGAPTRTYETQSRQGTMWVWASQTVIWDTAAERYYQPISVFVGPDGRASEVTN